MAAQNDITGDSLVSKPASSDYRSGWDRIFGKKEPVKVIQIDIPEKADHLKKARDLRTAEWHAYLQAHQGTHPNNKVPSFDEWDNLNKQESK